MNKLETTNYMCERRRWNFEKVFKSWWIRTGSLKAYVVVSGPRILWDS
jgi:hypothetical protein